MIKSLLEPLKLVNERLDYHPEGNTYTHTLMVIARARYLLNNKSLICAALLHDVCKAKKYGGEEKTHKVFGYKYWSNNMHPKQATELIDSNDDIKYFIKSNGADIDLVLDLVSNHMKIKNGIPKKLRSIPYIDLFRVCDDMVNRYDFKGHVYGYNRSHMTDKINYFGFSPIDIKNSTKTFTICHGKRVMKKQTSELINELPCFIKEVI